MSAPRVVEDWDGSLFGTFTDDEIETYAGLVASLRAFQDAVALMCFEEGAVRDLTARVDEATARISTLATTEPNRVCGRINELPVRGRTLLPDLRVTCDEPDRMGGVVRFGAWFLGAGAAAHGGAISLLFDDLLGRTAEGVNRYGLTRTAYLHVDYRHLVPIDVDLEAEAWIERVDGRKIFVRGAIRHLDGAVCAEATALMLRLLPEQGLGSNPLATAGQVGDRLQPVGESLDGRRHG